MKIEFSPNCKKKLKKIKSTDNGLFQKIQKQLVIFQQTPSHPSLRLHKLSGGQEDGWSISVGMSQRMLFYYRQSESGRVVVFFTLGKHEEVYR